MRLKKFNLPIGSQLFKALGDEARIRILFLLFAEKEMCISDLEQVLDFTQTKTSRHLTYLKNSGMVSFRKADQWVFYSIKEEVSGLIESIFEFMEKDKTLNTDRETLNLMKSKHVLAINKVSSKKRSESEI